MVAGERPTPIKEKVWVGEHSLGFKKKVRIGEDLVRLASGREQKVVFEALYPKTNFSLVIRAVEGSKGKQLGSLSLEKSSLGEEFLHLGNLSVHPDYQNKKIGANLLFFSQLAAHSRGKKLVLSIEQFTLSLFRKHSPTPATAELKEIYERYGFRKLGHDEIEKHANKLCRLFRRSEEKNGGALYQRKKELCKVRLGEVLVCDGKPNFNLAKKVRDLRVELLKPLLVPRS